MEIGASLFLTRTTYCNMEVGGGGGGLEEWGAVRGKDGEGE